MNDLLIQENRAVADAPALADFGAEANEAAARAKFRIYQERRPLNTQRSQRAALKIFADFMRSERVAVPDLYEDPWAWLGITWGLVQAFQKWQLLQGYAIKTIDDRVSVVKTYMGMANQAGVIPDSEILHLQGLRAFTRKEAFDMDARRAKEDVPTRRGLKKATATKISEEQAIALCTVRNQSPQGRRDAVMMCLLLDHGFRVSELAALTINSIDAEARQLTWYRQKTGRTSKHNLRGRAWQRLSEYLSKDHRERGESLLLASSKSGSLVMDSRMSIEAIRQRVRQLGELMGLSNLSPHDCRHFGATAAGRDPNVSLAGLMQWGSWESPTSVARYIDHGEADNDGVSLGMD